MFNKENKIQASFNRCLRRFSKRGILIQGLFCVGFLLVFVLSQTSNAFAAGVSLSATPTSQTVQAGQNAAYTININRDNYKDKVSLSATSLPTGTTASFNPNPTLGNFSTLTVTTKTTTPVGTYKIKVNGSASGITITPIYVQLIVTAAQNIEVSILPSTLSIIAGQDSSVTINISRTNYDGPVFLEAENLPDGVTISFEKNPIYGNDTRMVIYSHGLPHIWKDYEFEIKATAFEIIRRARLKLVVNCGVEWVEQYGSAQIDAQHNDNDRNGDAAVDISGNIYAVGNTYGTLDPQNPNQGVIDVWLAKYDNAGQRQWIRQLGTNQEDRVFEVAVDSAGNVFVGGITAGAFPGNSNAGNFDFWIAKYDSAGNLLWIKQSGSSRQDGKFGLVIVPDGTGGAKLTTFTDERVRVSTYTFDNNGIINGTATFNISLILRNTPTDLAIGPNGSIYVVGSYTNGNGNLSEYIVKFNSSGTEQWRVLGPAIQGDNRAIRVIVDSSDNTYIAGFHTSLQTFLTDAWITKRDSGGNVLWSKTESSAGSDYIKAIGLDNNGDVITAGTTDGVLGERNGGTDDAWLARRNSSDGALRWVKQFPVSGRDGFEAIAFDSYGGIILSGYTENFKNNIGTFDALLMRYADTPAIIFLRPSITGFSPASGRVGNTIRINGVNFYDITGVRFNGIPAAYTVVSSSAIDVVVPQGATTGIVTISKSCDSFSSPTQFTVLP